MDNQSNPHHLVLGELNDFLTDAVLSDTLDERYRQKIAKRLVLDKGFAKEDIKTNMSLEIAAGKKKAVLKVDFFVKYKGKTVVMIKYAPGSLVTRRLSTIALSRIVQPYQIPIVVITNGEDAEILDGNSGKIIATGLDNLLNKERLKKKMAFFIFKPIKKNTFDQASRIVYACEIDGACPCDSDVCTIE